MIYFYSLTAPQVNCYGDAASAHVRFCQPVSVQPFIWKEKEQTEEKQTKNPFTRCGFCVPAGVRAARVNQRWLLMTQQILFQGKQHCCFFVWFFFCKVDNRGSDMPVKIEVLLLRQQHKEWQWLEEPDWLFTGCWLWDALKRSLFDADVCRPDSEHHSDWRLPPGWSVQTIRWSESLRGVQVQTLAPRTAVAADILQLKVRRIVTALKKNHFNHCPMTPACTKPCFKWMI